MSLTSLSNLATPLTNKTHLVTLILVAALFGAFRWSQGRVQIEPANASRPGAYSRHSPNTLDPANTDQLEPTTSTKEQAQDNLLNDMIGNQETKDKHDANKPEQADQKDQASLDEIEQRLGLR